MPAERIAVVTGASSGIGTATTYQLAQAGFHVVAETRRTDRLRALAEEVGPPPCPWTSPTRPRWTTSRPPRRGRLREGRPAGQQRRHRAGLDPVAEGRDQDWQVTLDTNVVGLLRVTRTFLPLLQAAPGPASSTWARSPASRSTPAGPATPPPSTPSGPSPTPCAWS